MKKNPIIYLNHIHDCITKIKDYTKGMNHDDFLNNSLIQDGDPKFGNYRRGHQAVGPGIQIKISTD